jgi:hypothetical protein
MFQASRGFLALISFIPYNGTFEGHYVPLGFKHLIHESLLMLSSVESSDLPLVKEIAESSAYTKQVELYKKLILRA